MKKFLLIIIVGLIFCSYCCNRAAFAEDDYAGRIERSERPLFVQGKEVGGKFTSTTNLGLSIIGLSIGLIATNEAQNGVGVTGYGAQYGGEFHANGTGGIGLYGRGRWKGGLFEGTGDSGIGVYCVGTNTGGIFKGITYGGTANSPNGWGAIGDSTNGTAVSARGKVAGFFEIDMTNAQTTAGEYIALEIGRGRIKMPYQAFDVFDGTASIDVSALIFFVNYKRATEGTFYIKWKDFPNSNEEPGYMPKFVVLGHDGATPTVSGTWSYQTGIKMQPNTWAYFMRTY